MFAPIGRIRPARPVPDQRVRKSRTTPRRGSGPGPSRAASIATPTPLLAQGPPGPEGRQDGGGAPRIEHRDSPGRQSETTEAREAIRVRRTHPRRCRTDAPSRPSSPAITRSPRRPMDPKTGELKPLAFEGKTVTDREARGVLPVHGGRQAARPTRDRRARRRVSRRGQGQHRGTPAGATGQGRRRWPIRPRGPAGVRRGVSPTSITRRARLSARLTRAYTLDGKQWGQITFDIDLVIDPDITGGKVRRDGGHAESAPEPSTS